MAIEGIAFEGLWRLMAWLPGFILRRFFTKQWLSERARIDVRPRHDPVTIDGGELPEAHIWLEVSNTGHFLIELDRMTVQFIFSSVVTRFHYLSRTEIHPGAKAEIYVRGTLTRPQIEHISHNKTQPRMSLQVNAEFNSKIHNFSVDTRQLSGITAVLRNV